jgi:heterodisulfide reductase subunit A-like polyferredoxin
MDLRTFGKDFDKYAIRARQDHGVRHIRSRIHSVFPAADDRSAHRLRHRIGQ